MERGTDQLHRRPISEPSGVSDEDPAMVAGASLFWAPKHLRRRVLGYAQRRIDLGGPGEQAPLQVRGRGDSGTQRQLAGCEAAAAAAADGQRGPVRRNLRQAPWQLAQRDVDGALEVSGAEFMYLAHVDQARRRRACLAQQ